MSAKGKYLDPRSAEEYRREAIERKEQREEEAREAAWRRMVSWAGLVAVGGGLAVMILQGLIDQRIGVICLAVACAALGRNTK